MCILVLYQSKTAMYLEILYYDSVSWSEIMNGSITIYYRGSSRYANSIYATSQKVLLKFNLRKFKVYTLICDFELYELYLCDYLLILHVQFPTFASFTKNQNAHNQRTPCIFHHSRCDTDVMMVVVHSKL